LSDDERTLWTYAITIMWEWKKNKVEATQFIRNLLDAQLLNFTRRRYPEQLPQVAESILRGDRILARLDEMILLLKELLKEMKRRER